MAATAEGVFRIIDRASAPIAKITTAAKTMDAALESAGRTLDKIDSPQITQSIKTTQRNTETLSRTTEQTSAKVKRSTEQVGKSFEQMAVKGTASIEELTAALKRFEKERATATADVDIAKAEAKIRILKNELRTLSTAQARSELQQLGLAATTATTALAGTAGGGGGGPPRGGVAMAFAAAGGRALFMTAAIAAALPAIVALTGAVSALIGSLGAAVGGAGALGIGTLGTFVVGIGSIIAVAKGAHSAIEQAKDAQEDYNKAVSQYGRESAQAVAAHKTMQKVFRENRGAANVVQNQQVLGQRWRALTRPAQQDYFGILNEGLRTANDLLPTFGQIANRVLDSSRRAVEDFLRPFRGAEWRGIFRSMGDTFASISGPALRAFGNFALWMGRISRAASPVVIRMFERLEDWTMSLARRVGDRERTQQTVERLVGHLRDWVRMGGAAVRLMAAFFGAGATQGQSIVQSITEQFDHWTQWLRDNPGAVQDFFSRTIESAGKLVDALGAIVSALGRIGDAMLPLLNIVSDLTSMLGDANLLEPLALLAGGKLLLGGGRLGRIFGRGRGGTAGAAGGAGARGAVAGIGGAYAASRLSGGSPIVAARQAIGGPLRGAAGTALRGVGRFAGPLAAGLAIMDFATARGGFNDRVSAAVSGATLGLIPRQQSALEARDTGNAQMNRWLEDPANQSLGSQRSRLAQLQSRLAAGQAAQRAGGDAAIAFNESIGRGSNFFMKRTSVRNQDLENIKAKIEALQPVINAQVEVDQNNQASRAFDDLMQAFDRRWNQQGSKAAREGFLQGIQRQLEVLGPEGDKALLDATAAWTATMENGTRKQRRIARETKEEVVRQYRLMGRDVRVVNGSILDVTADKWAGVRKAVTTESEIARQEASRAFTEMQHAAAAALQNMGFSRKQANNIIRGAESITRQSGGRVSGAAALDAARGQGAAGARYEGLAGMYASGDGWGRLPIGGPTPEDRAARGANAAGGVGNLMGAKAGLGVYAQDASGFGLRVSSGLRAGSITSSGNTSYHASGDALDLAGTPGQMLAFAQHAASKYGNRLEELIYTPLGFSIKNGRRVAPYAQADHYDHVHIADAQDGGLTGGGGVGGASAIPGIKIRRPRSKAKGVFGMIADQMYSAIASGMEQRVNEAMGAGIGGGGRGGMAFNAVARLAESVGLPGITFAQIAQGESSLDPKAIGNDPGGTRGLGLWQITTGFNDDIIARFGGPQAMFNPYNNALAAKAIYDRQGIGAWYGTGFVTGNNLHYSGDGWGAPPKWGGWYGRGGEFTAHQPTLIGVGDGGAERVRIEPIATGGSKKAVIRVEIGKIINREPGDIEEIIQRELARVASDLDFLDDDDELS